MLTNYEYPSFIGGNIRHYQFCFLKAEARIFRHRQVIEAPPVKALRVRLFQEERPENPLLRGLHLLVRIVVWPLLLGSVVANPLNPGPRVGGASPVVCATAGTEIAFLGAWAVWFRCCSCQGQPQNESQAFPKYSAYYFNKSVFCFNLMEGFTWLCLRSLTDKRDLNLCDRILNMNLAVPSQFQQKS